MVDYNELHTTKNSVKPPVEEFLLLHGKKDISKQETEAVTKILKGFEVGLYTLVTNCKLAKPVEIKFVGEFLSNFCISSDKYGELSERGQNFIKAFYDHPDNECLQNAIEYSGCLDG